MTIRIQSPEGVPGRPGASLARSPELLAGRRLAMLDNGKPGAALLLSRVTERLAVRTGVVAVTVRRKGSAATPCEDALLDELVRAGDLVLTGTAD